MKNGRRAILIAEDDEFLRRAAETTLRRRGYDVQSATGGEDALRVARASPPDLVLLDLIMPGMQGFEVLRRLKADPTTRDIPVIVMTNLGQDRDREATIAAGALDYLVKADMSLEDLAEAVEKGLGVTP